MIGIKGKERPVEIRFYEKVKKSSGCWIWIGAIDNVGYGNLRINGKTYRAHRLSYELTFGPIQVGMCVLHRCDNRKCVNPDHLFLGTKKDNMIDKVQKGRCNCLRGVETPSHKLTDSQVITIREKHKNGISTRKIAREFGISHGVVWKIVTGRNWKYV